LIIDAHAHIFCRICGRIGSGLVQDIGFGQVQINGHEPFQLLPPIMEQTTFPAEVLLKCMEWAGVDKAVLLQGPFYGDLNAEVAAAMRRWPQRFVGAAFFDPWVPDAQRAFNRCMGANGLRIVKLELSEASGLSGLHPGLSLEDKSISWLWDELEHRNMVLTVDLGAIGSSSYQTKALGRRLDGHPELKVVIAHLGQPTPAAEKDPTLWSLWEQQVLLGTRPNVWFDTSALPHRASGEHYPFPSVGRWIRRAVELLGPQKLMWGSDAPALLTAANYDQLLSFMQRHLEFLPTADQELILGKTALEVYFSASTKG